MSEEYQATWEKRFMQKHYSYRDSEDDTTALLPLPPTLYTFGTNARAVSIYNWPNIGEFASGTQAPRGQCYARKVMVYVTQDTWIRFISLNPIYLTLVAQGYTVAQIAAMSVPQTINEVEHFVAAGDEDIFHLTYGISIIFRADTVGGRICISAEGNVEGGE